MFGRKRREIQRLRAQIAEAEAETAKAAEGRDSRLRTMSESEQLVMAVLQIRQKADQNLDLIEKSGSYYLRRHSTFSEREYRERMVQATSGMKQQITDAVVFAAYVDAVQLQVEYEAFERRFQEYMQSWVTGKLAAVEAEKAAREKAVEEAAALAQAKREADKAKKADMTAGKEI